jgi:ribosomal protein L37AE/L43A
MTRGTPKDPRSTQRKRARKVLFNSGQPYVCADCGCSPKDLPADAPQNLELAPVGMQTVGSLQADHENKNIMDNDTANLKWRCPSCHKLSDSRTGKGESTKGDEFGYGLENLY